MHRLAKGVAIIPVGHDFPPFAANKGGNVDGSKLFLLTFDLAFRFRKSCADSNAGGLPCWLGNDPTAGPNTWPGLRRLAEAVGDSAGTAVQPAALARPRRNGAGLAVSGNYSAARNAVVNLPSGMPTMNAASHQSHARGLRLRQIDASTHRYASATSRASRRRSYVLQVAMVRWFRNTLRGTGLNWLRAPDRKPQAAAARSEKLRTPPSFRVVLPRDAQDGSAPRCWCRRRAFEIEQRSHCSAVTARTLRCHQARRAGPGFELYEYIAVRLIPGTLRARN